MFDLVIFEHIFYFLLILTPIVFIHELGHYLAARKVGVKVEIFSVGFGKELYSWIDNQGTKWRIALIPLGGYVKMQGDTNIASVSDNKKTLNKGDLLSVSILNRLFIFFAGPLANFLLGILIFSLIYMYNGKQIISSEIGEILPNSAAEKANLLSGDIVKAVDTKKINNFNELRYIVLENPGRKLLFEIERNKKTLYLDVIPKSLYLKDKNITIGQLGVKSVKGEVKKVSFSEAIFTGFSDCYKIISESIKYLTVKFNINNFGSPIQIAEFSSDAAKQGIISFLFSVGYFSVAIGFLNLLPILPLDGGHIFFGIIELIFKKPVPEVVQNFMLKSGVFLLIGFMIVIILKDIFIKVNF